MMFLAVLKLNTKTEKWGGGTNQLNTSKKSTITANGAWY
ncbi:hypothetical protein M636_05810 [Vibrio parahaemolyticus O1:K33 str. CDC_K4557]|nr:hypothetical protein M636_05810 [Vibrio parahaemolyticus O1:K33 str. CDC_K4557]